MSFSSWGPCCQGEVGQGYHCLFLHIFFPHFSLIMFSVNSLQLLSFAVIPQPCPSLSRYLLTQSSHRILCVPCLLFLSTFWASDVFARFSSPSHSFHYLTALLQPIPHKFLLKTFLHPNLHSQFVQSSSICSLHSHNSSHPVVFV